MRTIGVISQLIIPLFILFVVMYGFFRKVRVYDSFICGAKEGLEIIIRIFPYVLAIFVAVKTFQASGAYDWLKDILGFAARPAGVPPEVFSVAIIKPLSGSASLGIFADIVKTCGADSLAAMISAVIIGSAETTFYVLAVYLGAVGIKKTKYLIPVCITADVIGILIAITVVKLLF
ncbi:MAG: spore maturation protein [Endomicrobiales bacterium]|nr:spore maturation protein [Endomicrobiales bacterium]